MDNDNRAVEIHSSSDDERVVSITAEEKEERQNNVDPWPHLKKYFKFIGEKNGQKCDLPMFGMLSNYQNSISKSSLLQQSKGALQECLVHSEICRRLVNREIANKTRN